MAVGGYGGLGLRSKRPERGPPFPVPLGSPVGLPFVEPRVAVALGRGAPIDLAAGLTEGWSPDFDLGVVLGSGVGVGSGAIQSEAIRIAKEQKSVSLAKRAEATYAEYRRQKAGAPGERRFRLPLG